MKGERAAGRGRRVRARGKRPLRSRRARCIISFSAQWALFAKVLKRGIKSNDHLLPEPVAAVVQKGRGETVGGGGLEIRAKVYILGCGDTSLKSERAKGSARKRTGREKDGEREALLHNAACVTRELHGDEGNKCAMKRRMRETGEIDVTCNFGELLNGTLLLLFPHPSPFQKRLIKLKVVATK